MTEQKKILIVDDCFENADSFKDALELFGHQAQCVYDWEKVQSLLSAEQFEIVFMDINLNNMSGITLLEKIKSSLLNQNTQTKYVAVSGYSVHDPVGNEAAKHFDFYLQKPINLENLETLLASIDS